MNNLEEKNTMTAEELREKILIEANEVKASDIHIEPTKDELIIRLRVDGILRIWDKREIKEYENFVSHLKILCVLDINQRILPQEGHFLWTSPRKDGKEKERILNIRVSFFPIIYGESVVMRLLNRDDLKMDLENMELNEYNRKLVNNLISHSYGMILVSGPAGSGKTTMLYSMLNKLTSEKRNIITLEDPVECYFPYIRQSKINPERGYTFATGIRSILRQDPDIIMIGEIRDLETAESAIRTSLTGRLLFSTFHSSSAISTISRLLDMKIERNIIAYALIGVINKRLVRKICENCKTFYRPSLSVLEAIDMNPNEQYFKGKGCKDCHEGFKGRIGLFEVLEMDEEIQRMIIETTPLSEIKKKAKEKGFMLLQEDGIKKIRAGLTTPEEILKAIA